MATRIINAGVSLTDTSLTTVYTCPAHHKAIIKELFGSDAKKFSESGIELFLSPQTLSN